MLKLERRGTIKLRPVYKRSIQQDEHMCIEKRKEKKKNKQNHELIVSSSGIILLLLLLLLLSYAGLMDLLGKPAVDVDKKILISINPTIVISKKYNVDVVFL
jgi:predicted nucleic acid-binding Zn ribbon protein